MADTIWAAPYNARQCPECKVWVYTAAGPFAEGDRSKTVADFNHWAENHMPEEDRGKTTIGFPYFGYNTRLVRAVIPTPTP